MANTEVFLYEYEIEAYSALKRPLLERWDYCERYSKEALLMFSQQLKRLAGPALAVGGLLWIIVYIVIVIIGLETGKLAPPLDVHSPALVLIGIFLLPLTFSPVCGFAGSLCQAGRTHQRARHHWSCVCINWHSPGCNRSDCAERHLWIK